MKKLLVVALAIATISCTISSESIQDIQFEETDLFADVNKTVDVQVPSITYNVRKGTQNFNISARTYGNYYNLTSGDKYYVQTYADYPGDCYVTRYSTVYERSPSDYAITTDLTCTITGPLNENTIVNVTSYAYIVQNDGGEKIVAKDSEAIKINIK